MTTLIKTVQSCTIRRLPNTNVTTTTAVNEDIKMAECQQCDGLDQGTAFIFVAIQN